MKSTAQTDLFVSPEEQRREWAKPWRAAAATAAVDPHWTPSQQRERAAYYAGIAEAIESGERAP